MTALQVIQAQVKQLLEAQEYSDWVPESKGFLDMEPETLRKMRRDPAHNEGWRYRPTAKAVDTKNRVVRRNIIWSKKYLMSLYVQA